ncbi:MAG: hypothetical protein NVSMB68_09110 [Thermoanaerobaculia bacterium]
MNPREGSVALLLIAALPVAGGEVRHSFHSAVPRGHVQRIVVDVPAGDVNVRNGAEDRLSVSGSVSRDPDSERNRAKEQRIADDTWIEIAIKNDDAVVKRHFGPNA